MLKLWQGKGGGNIIVSKSDPQHEMMQALGFRLIVGVNYGSMNRLEPGDLTIYRAADYLGGDSIYRCMRINDDVDAAFIAMKKDRHFRAKLRQQSKIVMALDEVISVSTEDRDYLACAACKRIFRLGNINQYVPTVEIEDTQSSTKIVWEYKNITCCDKYYAIGANLQVDGDWLAFCVSSRVFEWGYRTGKKPATDHEKLIIDYLIGRKEARRIERDNKPRN